MYCQNIWDSKFLSKNRCPIAGRITDMRMNHINLPKSIYCMLNVSMIDFNQPFGAAKRQPMRPGKRGVEHLTDAIALPHNVFSLPQTPFQHSNRLPRSAYWKLAVAMTPSTHNNLDVRTQFGNGLCLLLGENSTDRLRLAGIPRRDDEKVHFSAKRYKLQSKIWRNGVDLIIFRINRFDFD